MSIGCMETLTPRVKLFGVVRDRNGKPRIDGDPHNMAPEIRAMLTPEEYATACKEYQNATG